MPRGCRETSTSKAKHRWFPEELCGFACSFFCFFLLHDFPPRMAIKSICNINTHESSPLRIIVMSHGFQLNMLQERAFQALSGGLPIAIHLDTIGLGLETRPSTGPGSSATASSTTRFGPSTPKASRRSTAPRAGCCRNGTWPRGTRPPGSGAIGRPRSAWVLRANWSKWLAMCGISCVFWPFRPEMSRVSGVFCMRRGVLSHGTSRN